MHLACRGMSSSGYFRTLGAVISRYDFLSFHSLIVSEGQKASYLQGVILLLQRLRQFYLSSS